MSRKGPLGGHDDQGTAGEHDDDKASDDEASRVLRSLSSETVRLAAARRNPMAETTARFGSVVAKKLHGVFGRTRAFDAPLVQAVIDHTQLDVHCGYEWVNEFGEIVWTYAGRPWWTRVSDSYSRCTLGMALSFRAPSTEEVIAALKHAALPKTYTQAWVDAGHLVQVWEAMGLMQEVYADNALEFTGTNYAVALLANGISLATSPPNIPYSKAQAERGFGSYNQFLHRLSGTTFGKSNLRHLSYDGKTYACHDIGWLWMALHMAIEDVEFKFHKGIQDVPRRRWREGVQRFPVVLPLDMEQFEADLSIHDSRTIQRGGIEYLGLTYSGAALEALKLANPHVKSFAVRIDPEDLNFIRVIDPKTQRPVRIACTTPKPQPYPLREHILTRRRLGASADAAHTQNAGPSAQRSAHFQASDQTALERRAVAHAQDALRAATRPKAPGLPPPPDSAEAARHRALQMLKESRISPEAAEGEADSDDDEASP